MNVNNNSSNVVIRDQPSVQNTSSEGLSVRVALVALGVICAVGGMIAASAGDAETAGALFACTLVTFGVAALASVDVEGPVYPRLSTRSYLPHPIYIVEERPSVIIVKEPSRMPYFEKVVSRTSPSRSLDLDRHAVPGGMGRETRPVERHRPNPLDRPLDKDEHAPVGR